ncbi:hypothetical protein Mrose_02674 [Calidithermus roseus]|uniref:Uncharacterized protein n=1 Tax=Calidithermus roseus TaxID=1644118 RepID=A0A399EJM3_9DEIN|nr:hypothetical protein Mrose_02674 [Calidithermus roseus]
MQLAALAVPRQRLGGGVGAQAQQGLEEVRLLLLALEPDHRLELQPQARHGRAGDDPLSGGPAALHQGEGGVDRHGRGEVFGLVHGIWDQKKRGGLAPPCGTVYAAFPWFCSQASSRSSFSAASASLMLPTAATISR